MCVLQGWTAGQEARYKTTSVGLCLSKEASVIFDGEKGRFLWNICRRSFNVGHVDVQDLLLRSSTAFLNCGPLLEDCPGISYDGFAG